MNMAIPVSMFRAAALDWKMVLLLSVKSVLWTERSFRILEKEVRNAKDDVKWPILSY